MASIPRDATPFDQALQFIAENPGTGTALGLAKLILSMYSWNNPFGLGECARSFDKPRDALAVMMIVQYFNHGETDEIRMAGERIKELYPELLQVAASRNAGDPNQSAF